MATSTTTGANAEFLRDSSYTTVGGISRCHSSGPSSASWQAVKYYFTRLLLLLLLQEANLMDCDTNQIFAGLGKSGLSPRR